MPDTASPPTDEARWAPVLAGGVLVAAVGLAYLNSFSGAFVYDDWPAIVDNPAVRQLWPWGAAGDAGLPDAGRPLVRFSLALNHAFGGAKVFGYHALNLAIHLGAALALFGVVRRTLRLPSLRGRFGPGATGLAFAGALLWALHPLQTESVTYLVQRAESLMGLCFLLTLYGFVRSVESPAPGRWQILAALACLLGMTCKEVMVAAPLVVLLFDRTFVSGSFGEAWRRRAGFHAALAGTWLVLAWLVAGAGGRGGTAGFDAPVAWRSYALTQFHAVAHYLSLALWPHPLVFDYGVAVAKGVGEIWPHALLVTALVAAALVALWRRTAAGFLGVSFFLILAPSSSVVPIATETMAEHRMYLPLAAGSVMFAFAMHRLLAARGLVACIALAVGFGWLTHERNRDYRSELALWADTVAKHPDNARAHYNLGQQLFAAGNLAAAVPEYAAALRLAPGFLSAERSLGHAYFRLGRFDEARVPSRSRRPMPISAATSPLRSPNSGACRRRLRHTKPRSVCGPPPPNCTFSSATPSRARRASPKR